MWDSVLNRMAILGSQRVSTTTSSPTVATSGIALTEQRHARHPERLATVVASRTHGGRPHRHADDRNADGNRHQPLIHYAKPRRWRRAVLLERGVAVARGLRFLRAELPGILAWAARCCRRPCSTS